MVLTYHERPLASDKKFPTTQLLLLALCRVAEPIALTSIFPYSWVMVKDFQVANSHDASLYAGVLISAFSLAEALTSMFWGCLSDRIGRKPVILFGCFGTILSLLLVGVAPNFWVALFGRALGGFLNGNTGVAQTMVAELVKHPEHESRAYAVMPFVWSIGTIIGPAIGGLLAKPTEGFSSVFSSNGFFGKYPYLLPNLVCSVLLAVSIICSWQFLHETHPDMQSECSIPEEHGCTTPLLATAGITVNSNTNQQVESYSTFNQVHIQEDNGWAVFLNRAKYDSGPRKPVAFTWRVSMLILALAIFTYHSMTYDHLFPIFLQDKNTRNTPVLKSNFSIPGGVGLSTRIVGLIMSTDGVIALFIQTLIFPALAQWLGVWKLFVIVTLLHPITYFMVPFLVFIPRQSLFIAIYTCLAVRNILSIIAFPVLLILIKQASPSDSVLGRINGLAASSGAAARTIAPLVSGSLYSAGTEIGFTGLAWWASALVAVIGAVQIWFIGTKNHTSV